MIEKGGPDDSQLADDESDTTEVESWMRKVARSPDAVAPTPLLEAGEIIGGKYRIEEELGRGGMGAVYRATHVVSAKQVALKWMLRSASDERARQRFTREAHAAGRINHPNVVDVYDIGQEGEASYLVMELLRGESLRSCLARGRLAPSAAVDLLLPAMRGVAAAHREGVIHRDLKPDNIFLCHSVDGKLETVKVVDFGISKLVEDQFNPGLTQSGALLGTPYYMSPEQMRGLKDLDLRIDVYAFGVILYEALTGQLPFRGDNYGALAHEIGAGTPPRPRKLRADISPALEALILKAMSRDRDQRYADMTHLLEAIEALPSSAVAVAGTPFAVSAVVARTTAPLAHPRWRAWSAVALAITVGALWLAARWFGGSEEPSASDGVRPAEQGAGAATPPRAPAAAGMTVAEPPALPEAEAEVRAKPEAMAPISPQGREGEPPQPRASSKKRRPSTRPVGAPTTAVAHPGQEPAVTPLPATRTNAKVVAEDF